MQQNIRIRQGKKPKVQVTSQSHTHALNLLHPWSLKDLARTRGQTLINLVAGIWDFFVHGNQYCEVTSEEGSRLPVPQVSLDGALVIFPMVFFSALCSRISIVW